MPHSTSSASDSTAWCIWPGCQLKNWSDLPICKVHAVLASRRVADEGVSEYVALQQWMAEASRPRRTDKQSVVYYLRLEPTVVKIGVTTRLRHRVESLYSDLDSLMALEYGGRDVEQRRHRQFSTERIFANREKFALSDRLIAHIETLRPDMGDILATVA